MSPREPKHDPRPPKEVHWLDAKQEDAWRTLVTMMTRLRRALECQLERDADLSFIEYHTLARLSEDPSHTLRMSDLAEVTDASLSRLSHLVSRLEGRGFIRREPDPKDGRYTNAILTNTGNAKLVASAPAHVDEVRSLVIDEFSEAELRRLRKYSERLLARIESSQEPPTVAGA
jgi:DNA-binding MarR family transcriptional regulator